MNKQQLIDQAKKEFRAKFRTLSDGSLSYELYVNPAEELEEFLSQQIESAYDKGREDERKEWEKINE